MYKIFSGILLLSLFQLSSCSSGGDGGSTTDPAGTTATDSTKVYDRLITETGDPEAPYLLIDNSGMLISARTTSNNKLSGIDIIGANGQISAITINPETKLPSQVTTEHGIFLFENIRETSGLLDVTMVSLDGSTQFISDVFYKGNGYEESFTGDSGPESSDGDVEIITITPASKIDPLQLPGELYSSIRFAETATTQSDGEKLLEGSVLAAQLAGCSLTAAFIAGMIVQPELIPIFQALPLFAGFASAGSIASCGSKVYTAVRSMLQSPETTLVTKTQSTVDSIHLTAKIRDAIGACKDNKNPLNCAYLSGKAALSAVNTTSKKLFATLLSVRTRSAKHNFGIYCCDGPVKVELNSSKRWKAIIDPRDINDGILTTPYDYTFDFGETNFTPLTRSSNSTYTEGNIYRALGNHEIKVDVNDAKNTSSSSTLLGLPFIVEVVEQGQILDVDCCEGPSAVHVNQQKDWTPTVIGGISPYANTMIWNDGTTNVYRDESISGTHSYTEIGQKFIKVLTTDNVESTDDSNFFTIDVIAPLKVSCCTGGIGGEINKFYEWGFEVSDVIKPYTYEIDWGDNSKTVIDKKRVTRVTESHSYLSKGDYEIKVKITDASMATTTSTALNVTIRDSDAAPTPVVRDISIFSYLNFDGAFENAALSTNFNGANADIKLTGSPTNLQINWPGDSIAAIGVSNKSASTTGFIYAITGVNVSSFQNDISAPVTYGDFSIINTETNSGSMVPAETLVTGNLYELQIERFSSSRQKETAFIQFKFE